MPVEFKDYYAILGVAKSASAEEIKHAFRKLAIQYHPDKAKGDKRRAEERFKEINEAYEVLGDPAKREKYDTLGAQWNQPGGYQQAPQDWPGVHTPRRGPTEPGGFEFHFAGTGFSDFFEQFFGGSPRGRSRMSMEDFGFAAEEPAAQRGADIEGGLLVTLVEALHGATRQVSVQRTDPRTGQVTTQTYRVRIPAGVHEGQLIRLAGRGHEGTAGAGDLFLRVKFARHPDYRVRDGDLYHDLPLAPWEAVLGTQVTVPTPDGAVRLTVPAGTKNGQQFRLRGRGLPKPSSTRGDLYVIANIEVPTDVRSAERELWEKLRAQSSFQPRG